MGYMLDRIGQAAMYEQLAEEAAELAKAALKSARIIRGENPTPVTEHEASEAIKEECTDVMVCLDELGIKPDCAMAYYKQARFRTRWAEKNGEKKPEIEDRKSKRNTGQTVHRLCEQVRDVIDFEWKCKAYALKTDHNGKVSAEEVERVVHELYAMHRASVIKVLERYEDDAEYD